MDQRRGGNTQYLHQGYGSPDGAEANSRFKSCLIHLIQKAVVTSPAQSGSP